MTDLARLTASRGFVPSEYPKEVRPYIPQRDFDERIRTFNETIGEQFRKNHLKIVVAFLLVPSLFLFLFLVVVVETGDFYTLVSLPALYSVTFTFAFVLWQYSREQITANIDHWISEKNFADAQHGISWRFDWDYRLARYLFAGKLGTLVIMLGAANREPATQTDKALWA